MIHAHQTFAETASNKINPRRLQQAEQQLAERSGGRRHGCCSCKRGRWVRRRFSVKPCKQTTGRHQSIQPVSFLTCPRVNTRVTRPVRSASVADSRRLSLPSAAMSAFSYACAPDLQTSQILGCARAHPRTHTHTKQGQNVTLGQSRRPTSTMYKKQIFLQIEQ